jgi:hypothetical protein
MVTPAWVEVRCKDREADIPSVSVTDDRCEQHLCSRWQGPLSETRIDLLDGPKQPPNGAGVVVHADGPDGRQRDRTRMSVTYPNRAGPVLANLVPEPEAVAAAAFPLRLRETDPARWPFAGVRTSEGGERTPEIDSSLLEDLGGDLMPPGEPGHLLCDRPINSHDEDAAGILTSLPGIEGVDQVETRPWYIG